MKADIPKEERQRREREQWAEFRAALVRRHFQTVQDQMAIDATMARLEVEHLTQAAPAIYAAMGRTRADAEPMPAPVVISEPTAPPDPAPVAARPGSPDLPFDLRYHLGLR
ncbi:MAG: hypothetical protein E2598_01645 [Sphingobium sp.]|nr:hypothetical protein [Sphingobium sp.]